MIQLTFATLFIVLALLCFAAAAIGWPQPKRISLLAAGLFFLTLYFVAAGDLVHVRIG